MAKPRICEKNPGFRGDMCSSICDLLLRVVFVVGMGVTNNLAGSNNFWVEPINGVIKGKDLACLNEARVATETDDFDFV